MLYSDHLPPLQRCCAFANCHILIESVVIANFHHFANSSCIVPLLLAHTLGGTTRPQTQDTPHDKIVSQALFVEQAGSGKPRCTAGWLAVHTRRPWNNCRTVSSCRVCYPWD